MNKRQLLHQLEGMVDSLGGQRTCARKLRISNAHLSYVLRGKREPGKKLLRSMGLKKICIYEKV